MIKEIRAYIKGKILDADSGLKENPSAFYDNDIGESLLDKSYQITINNLSVSSRDSHIEREMDVLISIFGFGYRSQVSNYDLLLDKAICIEDKILDLKNLSGVETIVNIESNGIDAIRLPSNDDCFQININLRLKQAYTRE